MHGCRTCDWSIYCIYFRGVHEKEVRSDEALKFALVEPQFASFCSASCFRFSFMLQCFWSG